MLIDKKLWRHFRSNGRSSASMAAMQARADRMRDAGEFDAAASLYGQLVALDPGRAGLALQQGHCFKNIGRYDEAALAYGAAVGPLQAEAELQIGHLFRVTGNLRAARRSYNRAARLGSAAAAEELRSFRHPEPHRQTGLVMTAEARTPGRHELGPCARTQLLRLIARCEANLGDVTRLHSVGYELLTQERPDLARAVFELAFIWSGTYPLALQTQMRIGLQTGLWQEEMPLSDRSSFLPGTAPELHAALTQALPPCRPESELPTLSADILPPAEPMPPKPEAAAGEFDGLTQLISRVVRLRGAGEEAASVLAELQQEAATSTVFYAFGASALDVSAQIERLLRNSIGRFVDTRRVLLSATMEQSRSLVLTLRLGMVIDDGPGPPATVELLAAGADHHLQLFGQAEIGGSSDDLPAMLTLGIAHTLAPTGTVLLVRYLLARRQASTALLVTRDLIARSEFSDGLQQLASLFKQSGLLEASLLLQRRLSKLSPFDVDVVRDLAVLEKVTGNFAIAADLFRGCIFRDPGHESDVHNLLTVLGECAPLRDTLLEFIGGPYEPFLHKIPRYALSLNPSRSSSIATSDGGYHHGLALELAPEFYRVPGHDLQGERIDIHQIGWAKQQTEEGEIKLLRGVEAIRATCFSRSRIIGLRVRFDGRTTSYQPATSPSIKDATAGLLKYVFNVWIDTDELMVGPRELQLCFEDETGEARTHTEIVTIEHSSAALLRSECNSVVALPSPEDAHEPVETRVNGAPSVIRPASRRFFPSPLLKILVVRADQLGDFVASIPAIQRLRQLLPHAELCALVIPSNVELASGLGLFTKVFSADLVYDHGSRRRHMPINKQIALRRDLQAESFQLAIDLSPGSESRSLLRLTGAPHLVGFNPQHFPWLTFGIGATTRDPVNGKERGSHAMMVRMLVEAFGAALNHDWPIVPAAEARRESLAPFGIGDADRFVLIHSGARLAIKKWPIDHYWSLTRLILERTDFKIVMLGEASPAEDHTSLPDSVSSRFRSITGNVSTPVLEALIAHCSAFVGNDTGPKHLAALRGAPTVSVHMGQVNWDEWGQEGRGSIVSRRAPCVGCGIEDVEDCGKALACLTNIRPTEVFAALLDLIKQHPPAIEL